MLQRHRRFFLAGSFGTPVLLLLPFLATAQSDGALSNGPVQFNRDIRPILADHCFQCHGPDRAQRKAKLRLDTKQGAHALATDGMRVIEPGDASRSLLYQRITAVDLEDRMPPIEAHKPLSNEAINRLRQWIDEGATWESHWSFVAPRKSSLPQVTTSDWVRNPIDQFILARLEQANMTPSPEADPGTLMRRASLGLTGLPPTVAELDALLSDAEPDAYERLVDRLLASPAFGERMALDWLDAARYADSYGYHEDDDREMWAWRDWVIEAFNKNLPFDQFTILQLGGDLLPGATVQERIPTGFNRLHGVTGSGIPDEYHVEYVLDRVRTTATVWLGLTMGCAQCHDHKFDPISQEEFYEFYAFFNAVGDPSIMAQNQGNLPPLVSIQPPGHAEKVDLLARKIDGLEGDLLQRRSAVGADYQEWVKRKQADPRPALPTTKDLVLHLALDDGQDSQLIDSVSGNSLGTLQVQPQWVPGKLGGAIGLDGETYGDLGDSVRWDRTDAFSYGAWIYTKSGGGAVVSRMDDQNGYRGWDLFLSGFKIEVHMAHHWPDNALYVTSDQKLEREKWTHLFVTYDGSSRAEGVRIYVDGTALETRSGRDNLSATLQTEKPVHLGRRNPSGFFQGNIDDLRLYGRELTEVEVARLAGADPIRTILALPEDKRTVRQKTYLVGHYLAQSDVDYGLREAELASLRVQLRSLEAAPPLTTVMVMEEVDPVPETFVLVRGRYDRPGKKVSRGAPAALPPLPETTNPNRLSLARWLTDPSHPLTSRVAVNRYWQMLFGAGLVKTQEDFGVQGEHPSHPELLDWLATEFIASGWDVKSMIRLIVTSAAYRQSSRSAPKQWASDPANRLLGRGPRNRMPAEMVRDTVLVASGQVVPRLGGPSVKPYQPEGLWIEAIVDRYQQDQGANLFRRSLYTYWKRSVPPPNMTAFDAPNRETCTARRQRTNTPMMALVLMNDPTFVEASRIMAGRVMKEGGSSMSGQIDHAFRLATSRRPTAVERDIVRDFYREQRDLFLQSPDSAREILEFGEQESDPDLDPVDHAAWTVVARLILNLDETITLD